MACPLPPRGPSHGAGLSLLAIHRSLYFGLKHAAQFLTRIRAPKKTGFTFLFLAFDV